MSTSIFKCYISFFFNDTATTEIYTYSHTLSLHDALPIYDVDDGVDARPGTRQEEIHRDVAAVVLAEPHEGEHGEGGAGLDQLEVAGDRAQADGDQVAADDAEDSQDHRGDQRSAAGHRRPVGDALDDPIDSW